MPPLPPRKKLLVIHNPKAGARRDLFNAVLYRLRDLEVEVEVQSTTGPGSARDLARSAAEAGGYDAVIAAGGDGTINETVNGLSGHQIPLGIIPVGTANVLAEITPTSLRLRKKFLDENERKRQSKKQNIA